jgi:hypothetical protein
VNEKKFCLFFEQVLDTYRLPPPSSRKRKRGPDDADDVEENKATTRTLGVAPKEPADMREDDREEEDQDEREEAEEDATGTPLSTSTLDVWIAGVMELYHLQRSRGMNSYPNPRGPALRNKIDAYRRSHDDWERAAFVDRGLDGIVVDNSGAEFLTLNRCLLERAVSELNTTLCNGSQAQERQAQPQQRVEELLRSDFSELRDEIRELRGEIRELRGELRDARSEQRIFLKGRASLRVSPEVPRLSVEPPPQQVESSSLELRSSTNK